MLLLLYVISILTLHNQSIDFANVKISNRCAYNFQCFPIHIERYRGKYLLRRIPDKEAHIINGNIFGNVTKDKTRAISEQSQQTTDMNYCFTHTYIHTTFIYTRQNIKANKLVGSCTNNIQLITINKTSYN